MKPDSDIGRRVGLGHTTLRLSRLPNGIMFPHGASIS